MKTLFAGDLGLGYHEVVWDGTDRYCNPVSSGIYFYRLKAAGFIDQKKMILLR